MSGFVGRFVIIAATCAAVLFGGWRLALNNPDVQVSLAERSHAGRLAAARPRPARLDVLMAEVCSDNPCLMVRAGGREFLVGAGEGAADGLIRRGLLSAALDGVFLTELTADSVEGLAGVRDRTLEAGRKDQLPVFGPPGVDRVVEGVNAMLEASDAARALQFSEGLLPFSAAPVKAGDASPTIQGRLLFDSGVVRITGFLTTSGAESAVYRFEHESGSLIVAGCLARLDDILRAAEGIRGRWLLVAPTASRDQLDILQQQVSAAGLNRQSRFVGAPADVCLSAKGLAEIARETGAFGVMGAPLYPAPLTALDQKLWRRELAETGAPVAVAAGFVGALITTSPVAQAPEGAVEDGAS